MNTHVKICGIKNEDEINIINDFPVDYIGFILTKSKRQITIEKAKALKTSLNNEIKTVGVFMHEDDNYIQKAITDIPLDAVQLHGDYNVKSLRNIKRSNPNVEIFKTISVPDKIDFDAIEEYRHFADRILLDTKVGSKSGGTGKTFDWRLLDNLDIKHQIILAGGLNPDNIENAIKEVNPYMVDLNSGVETNLIKDKEKIKRAFDAIKRGNKDE